MYDFFVRNSLQLLQGRGTGEFCTGGFPCAKHRYVMKNQNGNSGLLIYRRPPLTRAALRGADLCALSFLLT